MVIDLLEYVTSYLDSVGSGNWDNDSIGGAVAAEQRAQRRACLIPMVRSVTVDVEASSNVVTADNGTADGCADDPPVFTSDDEGSEVTGDGIPAGTTIAAVDGDTKIRLSSPATASGSLVTLTIEPDISDLAEALARRVATNLANRNLPLGVQTQVAEFGGISTRVGGSDREVERLEGPYRRIVIV